MRHAAFLRGVNVGGHNRLRMADLREALGRAGLDRVSTHLQTGNVLFEADGSRDEIAATIEGALVALGCVNASAMVRTAAEVAHLRTIQPFDHVPEGAKRCLTFLREPSALTLPTRDTRGDLEMLLVTPDEVFSVINPSARPGTDLNGFIQSKLKVAATTRFWNVVEDIAALLETT